ncbi:hypothetical protein GCM10009127_20580 [Alteraurantiacibacter aestuarii]|uniref:TadE/TadG family type IV pilus assembly protein n=1 Tax=Alteraurantiacibacter aestuarii TaxID=650004 RepID=UPI0031CFEEBE
MAVFRHIRALRKDDCGAALVEFALVAPVLILALLGMFDMSYNIYAASMLEGAIQKAARDSSIEGGPATSATIDARVTRSVQNLVGNATFEFERDAYTNFADISRPEDFTDLNDDGVCNAGEPFEDVNGNNSWDSDRGTAGGGGARDAVLYTVSVTYDRKFPLHMMIGLPPTVTTVARTVLRNQPYATQDLTVTVGNCT